MLSLIFRSLSRATTLLRRLVCFAGVKNVLCSASATALMSFAVLVTAPWSAPAAGWSYQLQPGDAVKVSVFSRDDLTGTYRIRGSGDISFPLLGTVPAKAKTAAELEQSIRTALGGVLENESYVNVEVLEYQPFYIDGDVMQPGAYPFHFGLTVAEAVAVAGGRYSVRSSSTTSLIGQLNEQESFDVLRDTYWTDVALEARLVAERDGLDAIPLPEDLLERREDPRVSEIIKNEQQVFATRLHFFEERVKSLEDRLARYQEEIAALEVQQQIAEKKNRLIQGQLTDINRLAEKGTVARTQALQLEISAASIEQEVRITAVAIIRARRGMNQMEQALLDLRHTRADDIATSLQSVQDRLTRSRMRLQVSEERLSLLGASERTQQATDRLSARDTHFYITRSGPSGSRVLEAGANIEVLPGDSIEVPFPRAKSPDVDTVTIPRRVGEGGD